MKFFENFKFVDLFNKKKIDENLLNKFEELLIESDVGTKIASDLKEKFKKEKIGKEIKDEKELHALRQIEDVVEQRFKNIGELKNKKVELPYTKKDGTSTFHLIGLKLEERGNIPTIQSKPMLVELLEQIGEIEVVSGEDKIYRVEMESKDTTRSGAKDKVYESIKSEIRKHGIYRTYDRIEAARSSVFLEPIELPRQLRKEFMEEGLSED